MKLVFQESQEPGGLSERPAATDEELRLPPGEDRAGREVQGHPPVPEGLRKGLQAPLQNRFAFRG